MATPLRSAPLEAVEPVVPTAPTAPTASPTSWDGAMHGPGPRPLWVVTSPDAVEEDLGLLKTGKEADVHVVRRWVPGQDGRLGRDSVMAAKRFRSSDHRLFHRDAGYLEGRRVRKSRETRAMSRRTDYGRERIAGHWAGTEFATLGRLWGEGLPVPYPVQLTEHELLMELIGGDSAGDGMAAPRLATLRLEPGRSRELLPELFEQLVEAMTALARLGWAHGDLSPYNVLVEGADGPDPRLVLIDWPQVVDVVGNPGGHGYLVRDARTMCAWFAKQGCAVDENALMDDLFEAVSRRW